MAPDPQAALDLLARYGYLLVFLAGLAEAIPLLGFLVPGQFIVLMAGALAATDRLSLTLVILVAIPAGILGDALGYYAGRHYGRPFLERFGARLRIEARHLERSDRLFAKYGPLALALGRFSFLTRGVTPLLAGASKLRARVFWTVNVLGAVAWAVAYSLLGYAFGVSYLYLEGLLGRILAFTALAVLGLYGLYRVLRRYAHQFTREDLGVVLMGIVAGTAFGLLADMVTGVGSANWLDARQGAFHAGLAPLAPALAFLHAFLSPATFGVIALALFAYLAARRRPWEAGLVGIGMGGILLLVPLLQSLLALPDAHAGFPSSHAAASITLAGIAAYLATLRGTHRGVEWAAMLSACLLALAVAFAPLALAAARPTDVAAGLALGIAWLSVGVLIVEFGFKHDPLPPRDEH